MNINSNKTVKSKDGELLKNVFRDTSSEPW